MVRNSGAQAKSWWYYAGITPAEISDYAERNEARLIDIESWNNEAGGRVYAVIMIANTGEDATPWGWYYNVDLATLQNYMAENNYRILEFEVRNATTLRFDAVLVPLDLREAAHLVVVLQRAGQRDSADSPTRPLPASPTSTPTPAAASATTTS